MFDQPRQSEIEFLHACEHGHIDDIDRLIDRVDINCTDEEFSGLMLVCQREEPLGYRCSTEASSSWYRYRFTS